MSTLELPKSSKTVVVVSIVAFSIACACVASHGGRNPWLVLVAFLVSGFVGDLFTGFAHFGFDEPHRDYVIWAEEDAAAR